MIEIHPDEIGDNEDRTLLHEMIRLARTWIVSEDETQGLPRQHGLVHGGDLVREWIEE
jgi:hypothetical protein